VVVNQKKKLYSWYKFLLIFKAKIAEMQKQKKMLHHNPQQKKANDATNKKCRTTIIYSKAKQEKRGSK